MTHYDLYVMQSESGLIKIGRSRDVEARRLQIQRASGGKVEILWCLVGAGHREGAVLRAVFKYRSIGEWIQDTPASRAALTKALRVPLAKQQKDREAKARSRPVFDADAAVALLCEEMLARPRRATRQERYADYKAYSDRKAAEWRARTAGPFR